EVLATSGIRTPDLGGTATTSEVGQELERAIRAARPSGDGRPATCHRARYYLDIKLSRGNSSPEIAHGRPTPRAPCAPAWGPGVWLLPAGQHRRGAGHERSRGRSRADR